MTLLNDLVPPKPSLASRNMAASSRSQCIGDLLVDDADGARMLAVESDLERKFVRIFQYSRDVVDIVEQPPAVRYLGADGRPHSHTFDLLVTYAAGHRVACAIKPYEIAVKHDLWNLVKRIAGYMSPTLADAAVVLTEQKIDRVALRNAEIMHVCRLGDPDDDAIVLAVARGLAGGVPLGTLVELAGIEGRGFCAAVRLLAAGRLRMLVHERIANTSLVAFAEDAQ